MYLQITRCEMTPASYPDVSLCLSMKMCAQRKAGRRQRARLRFARCLYPSHGHLRFITSRSSTLRKTKRLRRRLSHNVNTIGNKKVIPV